MGKLYKADVRALATDDRVPWDALDERYVMVSGATGLLGGLLVDVMLMRNELADAGIKLILPVRNMDKARARFAQAPFETFVLWDASTGVVPELADCDFIIHCASNTDSRLMVERPVDTIATTVNGTLAMLELARAHNARMCFVSSMEVYGCGSEDPLDESRGGELDAMNVRSSYPQAKQMAETLCAAYASQYKVSACVARLAQSFGPGISDEDRRVFAEFARCCTEGRDITLLTDGSKSNMYVYTADAARALLTLVVYGERGCAYNVANKQTFCSIYQMAQLVAQRFGPQTQVTRVVDPEAAKRYAVSGRIHMDTSRMERLGWSPDYDLLDMFGRMMDDWH